jgi:allophanate hydrolase
MHADCTPFGITLVAPAGEDFGRAFHAEIALPLGATRAPQPPLARPHAEEPAP